MRRLAPLFAIAFAILALVPSDARAQLRKMKVVANDGEPIAYAYVQVEGGLGQITDEKGEISLGVGKSTTLSMRVRRIGYEPWVGKLSVPDTAASVTVTLQRLAQSLGAVNVSGRTAAPLNLAGFYDRWMMRQKGALSATFIGPEELEFRHPAHISDMLYGLTGVSMVRSSKGRLCARAANGACFMTIALDGNVIRPTDTNSCPPIASTLNITGLRGTGQQGQTATADEIGVDLNQYITADDIAAIEVYARGGNMPVSLQVADNACGVVAFWTGSRKP